MDRPNWNDGIMEWWFFGIMQYWANGWICVDDKIKTTNILLKTNFPVFHPSIIPCSMEMPKPKKPYIFNKVKKSKISIIGDFQKNHSLCHR
jgi:hypothetical protein